MPSPTTPPPAVDATDIQTNTTTVPNPDEHTIQPVVLGDYCSNRGASAPTEDGSTAYCARLAGTDAYIWSLTPGVAPNPDAQQQMSAPEATPPAPGDICFDPAATAADAQGNTLYCNLSPGGQHYGWQLVP